MIRVVADTNVLASGFAGYGTPESATVILLDAWRHKHIQLVASAPILNELKRTLENPYFAQRLTPVEIERALYLVRNRSNFVHDLGEVWGVATTPADDLILATAVAGEASLLVTGDRQLRNLGEYQGVRIVGPRAFVDWLGARVDEDVGEEGEK